MSISTGSGNCYPGPFNHYKLIFLDMEECSIYTDRLELKGINRGSIHTLFNDHGKEEILKFLGAGENGYQHYKLMHENGMETFRLSQYVFILVDKASGESIGECGFHTLNKTHRRAEVFYALHKDQYKQQGIMTEALEKVLAFGFTELGLHRVEALVDAANTASVKLLQRFGFSKEGTKREDYVVDGKSEDSDCYSLLRWEWDKQRQ